MTVLPRNLGYLVDALLLLSLGGCSLAAGSAEPPRDLTVVSHGDVVYRTQATGRIVPREEVFVRTLVPGQLVELKVRPGDQVQRGAHLATVRIIADPVTLSDVRAQVRTAEMKLAIAAREVERVAQLRQSVAVSMREIAKAEDDERIARTELESSRERLRLVSEGAAVGQGARSTRVVATIDGTVLATPVAVGDYVSETNSYRDGTTIAVIADMNQLLFKGQIEEAYVGKLKESMPATVRIGALEGVSLHGKLTWIAPRASIENPNAAPNPLAASVVPLTASSAGITRFELWIELINPPPGVRAGYSAAAELELERRDNVLVVEERLLRFDAGKVSARVYTPDGRSVDREVRVGVSDGVQIEITSGLEAGERIAAADDGIATP